MHTAFHREAQRSADAWCRRGVARFAASEFAAATALMLPIAIEPLAAIATAPASVAFLVRAYLLFVFLLRTPVSKTDTVSMYTTKRRTHLRTLSCLSMHPALRNWYLSEWVAALPVHMYGFTLIIFLAIVGLTCVHSTGLALVLLTFTLYYTRRSGDRLYMRCVTDAVEETLCYTDSASQYAESRSQHRVEQTLERVDRFMKSDARRRNKAKK